ncbi:MAG: hypothetical protein MK319_05410, partial [Pseudomonadales bacterium]|nr:hypothetical protein [Pseudomonadales bacterium]
MAIIKDVDSQPLTEAFSFTREKLKAIHGLRGILIGVVADKRLNEKEFLFLDVWLKSQQYLAEDPDVVNILRQVGDILEAGQISAEALAGMQEHIEQFISSKDTGDSDPVARIDELVGFLAGLAADILNDMDISALSAWLESNTEVKDRWPANVIVSRLESILEDGIVTEGERSDLLTTVNQFIGPEFDSSDVTIEASTAVWEDQVEALDFEGSTFCLTGDFVSGDRDSVDTMLKCKGSVTQPNVNKDVDYLVIGTLASR